MGDLFRTMFHDSQIAKLSYMICFGFAPYFKERLIDDIRASVCYVVSFDESYNKVT